MAVRSLAAVSVLAVSTAACTTATPPASFAPQVFTASPTSLHGRSVLDTGATTYAASGGTVTISPTVVMTVSGVSANNGNPFPADFRAPFNDSAVSAQVNGDRQIARVFGRPIAGTNASDSGLLIQNDLGTAFSGFAARVDGTVGATTPLFLFHGGTATTAPATGTATFTGNALGTIYTATAGAGGNTVLNNAAVAGRTVITADFANPTITGVIDQMVSGTTAANTRIDFTANRVGTGFTATGANLTITDTNAANNAGLAASADSSLTGRFYGPGAAIPRSAAGSLIATQVDPNNANATQRQFIGGFIATRPVP